MIKIFALNKESEDESRSEEDVTKEALEQIALQQYAKALELHRKGNISDATQLLKDLLDTEVLENVKKPAQGEKMTGPLFNLKYLCYKNLASMLSVAGDVSAAIDAYCAASELDDTDVTLWHRLGLLCIRGKRYEMALHAFQRGVERNPKHWPCLDKIVTLLLGLQYKEECISVIYETLLLDPSYLRGLVYRRHIYNMYPYIRDFMEYLNPIYKWDENEDEEIDEEKAKILLKEASEIQEFFLDQQKSEKFKYVLPNLKLLRPIKKLTWESVGDSLVHMHHYMTDNCFSHACHIEMVFETEHEQMEVCQKAKMVAMAEKKLEEIPIDTEIISENDNNDNSGNFKAPTDMGKAEIDMEVALVDSAFELPEPKKKIPARRRGSALSFLEQWEWCNKRRSRRKKPLNRQDRFDDNIYDTLRRMVPICLASDVEKNEDQIHDMPIDFGGLDTISEMKEEDNEADKKEKHEYFDTEIEQQEVKLFINKYIENKYDIIDILKDYLHILAYKWKVKWPESLYKIFIEANKCYNNHIDIPSCTDINNEELLHYTVVNLLVEEFNVNDKLNMSADEVQTHELYVIESIGMTLNAKPQIFSSTDILELMLRYLWLKLHIHMLNKCDELALDCLYQLSYEFEAMGEHCSSYSLNVDNFTFKSAINENEISAYIKFLERNKQLLTVMDLYDRGSYEEVLAIVIDSFEHCKTMARKQEEEMSLDFAVQLSVILDTYWALDQVDNCFKWSLICLHEALKHYFRYTSGSPDYEKWTLTVVKILCCMEHILTTEGLSCLDSVSRKELSQGLEDLIRIIGHQVETNAAEMPFGTVLPWIIIHYILQRQEDQGRGRTANDIEKDVVSDDEVPNPLMVLFIAHEQLGSRGWCCKSDGKLLYFILDTVVPRLRSPSLSKSLENVNQYMEQCVYCLFGHPGKKNKLRYLTDHNVIPHSLDWKRAQQLYEIFRPPTLPVLEGKVSGITADIEQLFHRILALLPPECDPQKYVPEMEKYIKGIVDKLPIVPHLLPYKMKDIYFLLGDYYFKKDEGKMAIKFNMLDIIVNNDRLESWAQISLAKVVNVERILNSCKNLNNEREFLNPSKSIIRCFKRALELDPKHCNMWIEYGNFVYTVHSFCSRLLKQASESLSMEDFEFLEKQKEEMLDTTLKCCLTVLDELNSANDSAKANEDAWLHYYMLGKVAEKRNTPPSVYLGYYMQGVKSLQETDATYPLKINYSQPTHLCIEVLELHYRIHASILKYIEQHENKPIPISVGKVFLNCIDEWKKGPFTKKPKKDCVPDIDSETKSNGPVHAANILKRSISDAGEDETFESKRLKLEAAAAKIKRSASYDTESMATKKQTVQRANKIKDISKVVKQDSPVHANKSEAVALQDIEMKAAPEIKNANDSTEKLSTEKNKVIEMARKGESSSSSSSSSSSGSSSSGSSSSSSDSSKDSDASSKCSNDKPLPEDDIMKIVSACLDALEDCASRFPPHYKAIYRLAHYHFYYKKGKDIERCRDLMLSTYTSRAGQKLGGLFSERKLSTTRNYSNFFNNIWKIPLDEVDRAGSFAFHMNRSVLLTMEILKEIDDHRTLLDLSLHLQRIPDPDKKYLRDSDREELAQQAFSLCVQSLKGQLTKFNQQADLKSNDVERQALKSLMLDIYRAYQRTQKKPNSKQFTNLLVEAYKLVSTAPITENLNLVDISMKFCQSMIQTLKQQATQASLDKSQNSQKKQAAKAVPETSKATTSSAAVPPKTDYKAPSTSAAGLPKMSAHEMATAFQTFLPVLNDPVLSQQTAAALTYLSNISALAGYSPLQNTIQSSLQYSLQNSFQAEFYRQFISQSLSSFNVSPPKKQKRGPKATTKSKPNPINTSQIKSSKSFTTNLVPVSKATSSGLQKTNSAPLAPSMGTVLPSLPASMTANLTSFGAPALSHSVTSVHSTLPAKAHMSTTSTVTAAIHTKPPMPHQQVSPGKTLPQKLAERQKNLPSISKNTKDINASISKLPSSLTITKTAVPKQRGKTLDAKKSLPFGDNVARRKPITSDEVIVLDDD